MEFIDISLRIDGETVTYPGNPEPEIERYRKIPEDSTTESEVRIGSHTGTHVDAPEHVIEDGESAENLEIEKFYGEAQVLDLTGCGEKVDRSDLENITIKKDIVLVKTENSEKGYEEFRRDFTYITLEAVKHMIQQEVSTVAIDYLSLTKFNGSERDHRAHRVANREMNVIEGVDLGGIEPGIYTFIGMPLKIKADGAPLRAVLLDEG